MELNYSLNQERTKLVWSALYHFEYPEYPLKLAGLKMRITDRVGKWRVQWGDNSPGRRFAIGSPSIEFWFERIGSWLIELERLKGFCRQHGFGKTVWCRIGLKIWLYRRYEIRVANLDEADLIILVSEGDPGLSGLVGADLGQMVPFWWITSPFTAAWFVGLLDVKSEKTNFLSSGGDDRDGGCKEALPPDGAWSHEASSEIFLWVSATSCG